MATYDVLVHMEDGAVVKIETDKTSPEEALLSLQSSNYELEGYDQLMKITTDKNVILVRISDIKKFVTERHSELAL